MSDKRADTAFIDEAPRPGESFLQRFHRRKTEARLPEPEPTTADEQGVAAAVAEPETALTDADMPPLETLDAESDYTGFLSPKVSESLRRAALRKLFHSPQFNVIDELDDYAEDFTTFAALGDIVTSDMRHMLEVEARKKAEALKQALLEEDRSTPDPAVEIGQGESAQATPETEQLGEAEATSPARADT